MGATREQPMPQSVVEMPVPEPIVCLHCGRGSVERPALITCEEAAERMGVHIDSFYRMVRNGRIPCGPEGVVVRAGEKYTRVIENRFHAWLLNGGTGPRRKRPVNSSFSDRA